MDIKRVIKEDVNADDFYNELTSFKESRDKLIQLSKELQQTVKDTESIMVLIDEKRVKKQQEIINRLLSLTDIIVSKVKEKSIDNYSDFISNLKDITNFVNNNIEITKELINKINSFDFDNEIQIYESKDVDIYDKVKMFSDNTKSKLKNFIPFFKKSLGNLDNISNNIENLISKLS